MSLAVPTNSFTIQIEMTSDWHVGSGTGRGEIDSEVQRDVDGLPYIPAKSLTGILRDACEQVALALDDGNNRGKWYDWVNFLFGDQPNTLDPQKYLEDRERLEIKPRPTLVSIRSAHLDSKLRNALKARPKLKSAIAFIKPGVAIDSATGSAKPDFLRFEEVVRIDAVLTSKSSFDLSGYQNIAEDEKKVAYALLIAGAKIVERLGGKRRRGNGNCKISIVDAKTNEWLQWLKENHDKVGNPPQWNKPELNSEANHPEGDSTWFTVPFTIATLSPIVLPKRTVGNVVECLDYIPGRYFLGYLHKVLGKHINVSEAIARGDLVVTNATISIGGVAGRPTPFCLFGEKLDGGLSKGKKVYNRFQEPEPKDNQDKEIQTKGERSGYLGEFDDVRLPEYKTVKLEVNTHNTIDDKYQRPSPETGGAVYSYQAIPAQITLKAELRLPRSIKEHLDKKSSKWWTSLAGDLQIGQSKKDQYGSIRITVDEPKLREFLKQASQDNLLYVWFLSDILLRDKRLNLTTDPDAFREVLANELEVKLTDLSLIMKSHRTESWQVRWGLPRPSLFGWMAGSCVVYEVEGSINCNKLAELEAKGIGDRRAEGYGQICFNDSLLTTKLWQLKRETPESSPNLPTLQPISQSDPSFDYARTIEISAWREAIENKALAIAANREKRKEILGLKILGKEGYPTMSQLGGVRSNLKKLQSENDIPSMTVWIESLQSKREDKWEKTNNGLNKISLLVTRPEVVWNHFEFSSKELEDLVVTTVGVEQLRKQLWAEAVRTLVDAVIRAHKRDLEKAQREAA